MKLPASFFAFLLVFTSILMAAEGIPVSEIVDKAIKRDIELINNRQKYIFDLTILKEKLDKENHTLRSKTTTVSIRSDKEIKFESNAELSAEEVEKRKKLAKDSQKIRAVMDFRKLVTRFNFELQGEENFREFPCYVVSFSPKPDQPYDSREEKVINQMMGKLWISKKDFAILKTSASLSKPVSVAWFFATVEQVDSEYESQILPNGDIVPATFSLLFDIETAISNLREKHFHTMTNYRAIIE